MIASIRGRLTHKQKNEAVIEAGGVGYHVFLSLSASRLLSETGKEYGILTYLNIKENSMQLFGFTDMREREIFRLLISVSGIGPKLAHAFLSSLSFEEIVGAIAGGGKGFPVRVPGLGQKKLELISMSLKDKIFRIGLDSETGETPGGIAAEADLTRLEALNALINLGYQRSDAEKIIREALKSAGTVNVSTEELIRKSLEFISK